MRAGAYSPNHVGNDANILNSVAEQLRKRGCEVVMYSEEEFGAASGEIAEEVVLNMARERRSTTLLQDLEDRGALVVNSAYGVENCIRERQTLLLQAAGLPFPESVVVDTDQAVRQTLQERGMERCWLRRGDFHALHKEDATYVRTPDEAQDVLQEFFLRGFRRAVISRHVPGRLIKFYGVNTPASLLRGMRRGRRPATASTTEGATVAAGDDFFYWFRPYEADNLDQPTGEALRELCRRAARELNLVVYGGEAIQGDDGQLTLIGINDWPSFSPCRREAAVPIAKTVLAAVKARAKKS